MFGAQRIPLLCGLRRPSAALLPTICALIFSLTAGGVNAETKYYWPDSLGVLHRSNADGSNDEILAYGLQYPTLRVDPFTGTIFAVSNCRLLRNDGSDDGYTLIVDRRQPILNQGCKVMALDPVRHKIYWREEDWTSHQTAFYSIDDNTAQVQAVTNPTGDPHPEVEVSEDSGSLYWLTEGKLFVSNSDGSDARVISSQDPAPTSSGLLFYHQLAGKVFWSDFYGDGASPRVVYRSVNADGSQEDVLASVASVTCPIGFVDYRNQKLYSFTIGMNRIARANLDCSDQEPFGPWVWDPTTAGLDQHNNKLYFHTINGIHQTDLNGDNWTRLPSASFGGETVIAPRTGSLYWLGENKIFRSDLNGTRITELNRFFWNDGDIDSPPDSIAVDDAAGFIFSATDGSIFRSEMDGSNRVTITGDVPLDYGDTAVDKVGQMVYRLLTDIHTMPATTHLFRCKYDGSGLEEVSFSAGSVAGGTPPRILRWSTGDIWRLDPNTFVYEKIFISPWKPPLSPNHIYAAAIDLEGEYDDCPLDDAKIAPGVCGCGTPDTDANSNGIMDCLEPAPTPTPQPTLPVVQPSATPTPPLEPTSTIVQATPIEATATATSAPTDAPTIVPTTPNSGGSEEEKQEVHERAQALEGLVRKLQTEKLRKSKTNIIGSAGQLLSLAETAAHKGTISRRQRREARLAYESVRDLFRHGKQPFLERKRRAVSALRRLRSIVH